MWCFSGNKVDIWIRDLEFAPRQNVWKQRAFLVSISDVAVTVGHENQLNYSFYFATVARCMPNAFPVQKFNENPNGPMLFSSISTESNFSEFRQKPTSQATNTRHNVWLCGRWGICKMWKCVCNATTTSRLFGQMCAHTMAPNGSELNKTKMRALRFPKPPNNNHSSTDQHNFSKCYRFSSSCVVGLRSVLWAVC